MAKLEHAGRATQLGGQLIPVGIAERLMEIVRELEIRQVAVKDTVADVRRQVVELRKDRPDLFELSLSDADVTLLLCYALSDIGAGPLFPVERPS